jgi:hypothetical protein
MLPDATAKEAAPRGRARRTEVYRKSRELTRTERPRPQFKFTLWSSQPIIAGCANSGIDKLPSCPAAAPSSRLYGRLGPPCDARKSMVGEIHHHYAGQDAHREQMHKVRRAKSRFSGTRPGSGAVHV